jgi:hypothetical protein
MIILPPRRRPDEWYEQVPCTTCNIDGLGGIEGCPQCKGSGTIQRGTAVHLAGQRKLWMHQWRFGHRGPPREPAAEVAQAS